MDRSRIGIVIPALNESATIAGIISVAANYGMPIVVDDGSTDDTAKLAGQLGAIVVVHDHNFGYDAALNSGFNKAASLDCEIIITLDADGQHDPNLLKKFIDLIETGVDVVVGIRSKQQRLAEKIFSFYTTLWYGIKDPLCGMKAYRVHIYRKLGYFDSYRSIGTEMLLFAAKNEYRIGQLAFRVRERQDKPRFGKIFIGNHKILRALVISFWRYG